MICSRCLDSIPRGTLVLYVDRDAVLCFTCLFRKINGDLEELHNRLARLEREEDE